MPPPTSFVHVYRPSSGDDAPTLLMLHGTGGNEQDLVPMAGELLPGAGVLSPRGRVLEGEMPRFFRRVAEGVFDLEDLREQTAALAAFIDEAARAYGFARSHVYAAGFSNGANIAASLLLLAPGTLAGAILFRAMVPIVPDPRPAGPPTPVLISNGRLDPLVPQAETERLAGLLRKAGAEVTVAWHQAGHRLVPADVSGARLWLEQTHGKTLRS